MFGRQQIVSNNSSMAAPPHAFCTHDGHLMCFSEPDELVQVILKRLTQCVIRIIVKALVLPRTVDVRIHALLLAPPRQTGKMTILHARLPQGIGQPLLIVLWKSP